MRLHDLGGSGPVVVVFHATGFCARAYAPLAARWAGRFSVLGVDLRGHGDAPSVPGGDYTYRSNAADVVMCLERAGIERCSFFGHSMGGAVALLVAAMRPDLVDRVYAYDPSISPDDTGPADRAGFADAVRRRRAEYASRGALLDEWRVRLPYSRFRSDALEAYVEHGTMVLPDGRARLRCRPDDEAAAYEQAEVSITDLVGIETPVMIAWGDHVEFPGLVRRSLADALPRGRAKIHHETGHFGPFERPDEIAEDAARWFVGDGGPASR